MRLHDYYDIPESVVAGSHSETFSKFLWNWFGNTSAVGRNELDVTFLRDLAPGELSLARELVRRNLRVKHLHIIRAAGLLQDQEAAPILKSMLDEESDLSWRLTIAGSLWRINRDPIFVQCLDQAKAVCPSMFQWGHLFEVLWLEDERSVDFLIDLLDQKDAMGRAFALNLLNTLEFERIMGVPPKELPHQPGYYRRIRQDGVFRAHMVEAIRGRNAASISGR